VDNLLVPGTGFRQADKIFSIGSTLVVNRRARLARTLDGGYYMINTLKYAKKLEEAGFSRQQAEANIQIIAEIVEDDVATKQDLKHFVTQLETKIGDAKADLKNDMTQLEYRLVVKLSTVIGAMITLAIAVTTAVAKFL
jgi:hypothetical protein